MEGYRCLILPFLTLFSSLQPGFTEKNHTHFFFTTITNDSTYDYPAYYTTRFIDDILLFWYDSDNMVIERKVPWFKSTDRSLLQASLEEYKFQLMLQAQFEEYTDYMNDTEGFQMLQLMDGCILYDNGSLDVIFTFYYNGDPFMSLNMENGTWVADDPRAQVFADRNNRNKTVLEQNMDLLMNSCVPHILELLALGSCTFTRQEQPVVVLTQTPITDSTYLLSCRAYGHYPKDISMTWYNNGEPVPDSLMEIVTLPLPDNTYLTWLSMNITPEDEDDYVCRVDHTSMAEELMARLVTDASPDFSSVSSSNSGSMNRDVGISDGGIIGICLAVIVVVVFIVFTYVWWANRRRR